MRIYLAINIKKREEQMLTTKRSEGIKGNEYKQTNKNNYNKNNRYITVKAYQCRTTPKGSIIEEQTRVKCSNKEKVRECELSPGERGVRIKN